MSEFKFHQPISEEIARVKYYLHGEESAEEVFDGVSEEISLGNQEDRKSFYTMMVDNKFIPAGRILANARRNSPLKNYGNCYVIEVNDSMVSIYSSLLDDALIGQAGGGVGFNISKLRPKGSPISKGGTSSGPMSFLEVFDTSAKAIHTGGGRRGAHIVVMNVDHPDIEEFILYKRGDENKKLTQFNISVGISDKFMNAVIDDLDWDLVFEGKIYKTIKAKYLYDLIVKNSFDYAEPGILFLDTVNRYNNGHYLYEIDSTNPCFTGDTLVAVADGRNAISIKRLAEESCGKIPFPVYSGKERKINNQYIASSHKTEIKNAVAFRTGEKEVIEIVLSDGTSFRCTPEHLLATKDGRWVEAQNSEGEQLEKFYSFSNKDSKKNYRTINSKTNGYARQYRMIYEFYNDSYDGNSYTIDHKDSNASNDKIENLILLEKQVHDEKSKKERKGENNPIFRMDADLRKWINKKRNINANATKYDWTEERRQKVMDEFLRNNPKPEIESDNLYMDHRIYVEDVIWKGEIEEVYDLTVEDNHNFYIITDGDSNYRNSCGVLVHNCGEQPLPPYSVCNLGSLVLSSFVREPFTDNAYFDFEDFISTVKTAVKFMDNVIDASIYPLHKIQERVLSERRIGLGITALGDMFAMLKLSYGSSESISFMEILMETLMNESYKASALLAKEKGAFPLYKGEEFVKGNFFKKLRSSIQSIISDYGIRNIALLNIAPTGTTSLTFGNNCSSGIEPIFSTSYDRTIRTNTEGETKTETVYSNAYRMYKEITGNEDVPDYMTLSNDIPLEGSVNIQAVAQKYMDASISKTITLPNNASVDMVKDLFIEAWKKELKGITIFNPNGKLSAILSTGKKEEDTQDSSRHSAKRPKELECDIYTMQVNKQKVVALVGMMEGKPYEVFITDDPDKEIHLSQYSSGIIKKVKQGKYDLKLNDEIVIEDISQSFNHEWGTLGRMISMSLRHDVPIQFVIEQLNKTQQFGTFSKAVARVLKKYLEVVVDRKEICPECGSEMINEGGCITCKSCGYSKCE